ncbi:hypothetical protein D9756_002870 [Leucocoprinus leucothites]|uniref:amidase n=1 Tax=Leucocoprinus leucothites TaxID=201217 RepID=A0A8H5G7L8_9AGAR|nr:hypothetical protein D9756_002870 [Leucoagaricus leucothites]
MARDDWKDRVAAKRRQQLESIPKDWILADIPDKSQLDISDYPRTCGLLTNRELEITESHVDVILSNVAKGNWSSVEVTTAFSKRAIIAHQLVNCLTEIFIESALARAATLDDHFKRTGKVVGPLHGKMIPYLLTSIIIFNALYRSPGFGYVAWIDKPATKNAVIADILESLGAVLYVKTNVPQTLGWGETHNNIFGRTLNPFNRTLTAGGSSGGEGALIALKGSPLGVGTDIGGSIRIPAGFNDLYGLRTSYNRLPFAGCVRPSGEGQNSIIGVLGPMATSMEGVKTFMKSLLSKEPWEYDALVVHKQWNEDEYRLADHNNGKELCFAIMWDDGTTVPHPPVTRGLEITKAALLQAGHRVIDWQPIRHPDICKLASQILGATGNTDVKAVLAESGEPFITTMAVDAENVDQENSAQISSHGPPGGLSASEYWQLNVQQSDLRQLYLDRWRETAAVTGTGRPVDAIICPVAPFVAPPHGKNTNYDYTFVWNVLDYPSCVVPVGSTVDPLLDAKKSRESFYSEADRRNWEAYEPSSFENAPIGIQVVCRTLEDEAVVGLSEFVDNAIKAYKA